MSLSNFNVIFYSYIQLTLFLEATSLVLNKTINSDIGMTENIIPIIQKRLDNDSIKKSLDEYTMVRKKTHFTIPYSNNEVSKQKYKLDNEIQNSKIIYTIPSSNITGKSFSYSNKTYLDMDNINNLRQADGKVEFSLALNEMFKVLTKQGEMLIKMIENIESGSFLRNKGDFENLLEELDRKNEAPTIRLDSEEITKEPEKKKTETEKPSTIMTVFDETKIRETLKNDPYVKRIMKMANKNREDYIKAAKKYYNLQK